MEYSTARGIDTTTMVKMIYKIPRKPNLLTIKVVRKTKIDMAAIIQADREFVKNRESVSEISITNLKSLSNFPFSVTINTHKNGSNAESRAP